MLIDKLNIMLSVDSGPPELPLIEIKNVRLPFAFWKLSACQTNTPNAGVTAQFLPGRTRGDIGYCAQAAGRSPTTTSNGGPINAVEARSRDCSEPILR